MAREQSRLLPPCFVTGMVPTKSISCTGITWCTFLWGWARELAVDRELAMLLLGS